MKSTAKQETGFALLMTLIVVGVVLSVGLSMLDLALKQVRLSSNAKDSEIAFHATNAGLECAQYWRLIEKENMEIGANISPQCFGVNPYSGSYKLNEPEPTVQPITGVTDVDLDADLYTYSFQWGGTGAERCTKINTLVASSSVSNPGNLIIEMADMRSMFPGYPATTDFECDPGSQCTVISVKGYNKPCGSIGGYGVVEREILLQF